MEKNCVGDHNHMSCHIKEYLRHLAALKYSPKSLDAYKNALTRFSEYLVSAPCNINRVQDVTVAHLTRYRLELVQSGRSDATIYLYLRCVRSLFSWLEKNQDIFVNPAAGLVLPKCRRKLQPVPNEEDVKKLLQQPDTETAVGVRDRALLETAYSGGLRRAELAGLTVFDPDFKQKLLRVIGKGNKQRVVPLGKTAVFWLKRYISDVRPNLIKNPDEQALWIGKTKGARLTYARIDRLIRDYALSAGIKQAVSCHAIRRACATHMLRNGAHPVQLQMLLGHATLQNLSQYLKVTITDMKKMHEQSRPGR